MPVLIMVGATLLVMLAVPLGFLAVSGFYFARRTATWLVPLIRRSAADARRSTVDFGVRSVDRVVHSRLPQALMTGALGCALALPALAAPVRAMEPGWGGYPQQSIGSTSRGNAEAAARIADCCAGPSARPVEEQGTNQVRSGPSPNGGLTVRTVTPVDQCIGDCGRLADQSGSKSKDKSKLKAKSGKKSKSKA